MFGTHLCYQYTLVQQHVSFRYARGMYGTPGHMLENVVSKRDDILNLYYLEYHKRQTKTRTGEIKREISPAPPRL